MRTPVTTIPAVAARLKGNPLTVYVGGHTKETWLCPNHGEYIQEPWVVVRSYKGGATSLGCPDCRESSVAAKARANWAARRNGGKGGPQKWSS